MQFRLSAFWYFYLGGWGIFFPYYSLYLGQDLGLSGARVGLVMAVIPLVGLVAQPLWGQLADRTGSRRGLLALSAAGTALACAALVWARGFPSALYGTAVFAVCSTAVLPMATAVSLASVGRTAIGRFGLIRMWGTLGFLTMVVVFPRLLRVVTGARLAVPWQGLAWMFPATALCLAAGALVALRLREVPALSLRAAPGDARRLLRHTPVVRLMLFAFTAHLFMQGTINFFPLYVRDRGGDVATVGRMWIFMLLIEIPLIGFSGRTLRHLGARGLLTVGLLAEGLRWTICAATHDLALIAAAQLLHGVGVAGVLVGAPLYLEQSVPEALRSTGQALIATASVGAAAIVSNTVFGWLMDHLGISFPYAVCGAGAFALGLLTHRVLPPPHVIDDPGESIAAVC